MGCGGGGAAGAFEALPPALREVSQPTASIHVGVSKRVGCVTRLIALQEYLPEGAALGDLGPGAATFGEDGLRRAGRTERVRVWCPLPCVRVGI